MTRWLVIVRNSAGGSWVLTESPVESISRDHIAHILVLEDVIVCSREEALADPELRLVVEAWDRRDDSAYRAWWAVEDAEMTVSEHAWEARRRGDLPDA